MKAKIGRRGDAEQINYKTQTKPDKVHVLKLYKFYIRKAWNLRIAKIRFSPKFKICMFSGCFASVRTILLLCSHFQFQESVSCFYCLLVFSSLGTVMRKNKVIFSFWKPYIRFSSSSLGRPLQLQCCSDELCGALVSRPPVQPGPPALPHGGAHHRLGGQLPRRLWRAQRVFLDNCTVHSV